VRQHRARLRLVLVTLFALASLGALVVARPRLSGTFWSRGDDLALAVAWFVAVAASVWLFVATGASLVALGFARPRLARRFASTLPVGIRRMVEVAIVGSCLTLPALPAPALGPPRLAAAVVSDQPVVRAPETSQPNTTLPTTVAPAVPAPMPRPDPAPSAGPAPSELPPHVVVRAGDSLWLIARASLAHVSATRPDDTDVARYWLAVVAANRSTLRSGNPSLIFPGEIVALPRPFRVS
jgi:nucleoid-associated protein YgaU